MGFLDNLIREGTRAAAGHFQGKRLGEAEARRRGIQDDELEQRKAMHLFNLMTSRVA